MNSTGNAAAFDGIFDPLQAISYLEREIFGPVRHE